MSTDSREDFNALHTALQDVLQVNQQSAKAMLALRTELMQREQSIRAAFSQELQSLRAEVSATRKEVSVIVGGAKDRISDEARQAVAPVAAEYGRAVTATSAQLQGASRTVWMWFAAGGAMLLLTLAVGWMVLGYYRRELATAQQALARYENAIPVVQAFHASDAVVCGDRICIQIDPNAKRQGSNGQYRVARPRPR